MSLQTRLAALIAAIGADIKSLAAGKADASKGVTNGDAHDHSGGDGAQIAYSSLSGLPTLGTAAPLNVAASGNAAASEVVKGNDTRLSDSREWTAATVDQAEAEAGTATTRRAWTAQRVRQAIAAWWDSVTHIDGKVIGQTTPAAGSFTTLSASGNTTVNGYMGVGGAPNSSATVYVQRAHSGTSAYGVRIQEVLTNAVTSDYQAVFTKPILSASTALIATNGVYVDSPVIGPGASTTNYYGIRVADSSVGTNNYGITSLVSAGTNKWNIYASGTAANYFAGNVGIGTSSPAALTTSATVLHVHTPTAAKPVGIYLTNADTGATANDGTTLIVASTTGDFDVIQRESANVKIYTAGTERLRITSTGVVRPGADNTQSLGEASFRWSTVFAGTGTINTSDATLKTELRDFSDAELDAIGDCRLGIFQWLDAVAEKGEAARLHPGVIAQQIMSAFVSHGLDPLRYAPICRDAMTSKVQIDSVSVWKQRPVMVKDVAREERIEVIDGVPTVVVTEHDVEVQKTEPKPLIGADGNQVVKEVQKTNEAGEPLCYIEEGKPPVPVMETRPVLYPVPVMEDYLDFEPVFEERDAGWRYGIRYSQLLIMLAAHERRERERLASRLDALEAA